MVRQIMYSHSSMWNFWSHTKSPTLFYVLTIVLTRISFGKQHLLTFLIQFSTFRFLWLSKTKLRKISYCRSAMQNFWNLKWERGPFDLCWKPNANQQTKRKILSHWTKTNHVPCWKYIIHFNWSLPKHWLIVQTHWYIEGRLGHRPYWGAPLDDFMFV